MGLIPILDSLQAKKGCIHCKTLHQFYLGKELLLCAFLCIYLLDFILPSVEGQGVLKGHPRNMGKHAFACQVNGRHFVKHETCSDAVLILHFVLI